jgi:precorrin-6B methylase 2
MNILIDLFAIFVLLVVIYLLGRPIVRGAIYFPTSHVQVDLMIRMASLKRGDVMADLGSGDGRMIIACARQGIRAEGYEINPLLVFFSRRDIRRAGLQDLATVRWKSLWRADLAPCDAVFVYGIPYIMDGLRQKLERELRPGAKVVSNTFPFPDWAPLTTENKIYLYSIGPKSGTVAAV